MYLTKTIIILTVLSWQLGMILSLKDFPLSEFLNTTDAFYLDDYHNYMMCSGGRLNGECCMCREICFAKRQCCLDYLWTTINQTNASTYKELLLSRQRKIKDLNCVSLNNAEVMGYRYLSYSMVTTCLPRSNLWITHLCSNTSDITPVVGDDEYLYKNQFCAKCNGVEIMNTVAYILECVHENSNVCKVRLGFKNEEDYQCEPYEKNCKPDNEYYELCNAFIGPFVVELVPIYANYFCFLCNKKEEPDFLNIVCNERSDNYPFAWSSILRIDDPLTDVLDHDFCKGDKLMEDPFGRCVNFYCPRGYEAKMSQCIKENMDIGSDLMTYDDCFFSKKVTLYLVNLEESRLYFNLTGVHWSQSIITANSHSNNVVKIQLPYGSVLENNLMPELYEISSFLGPKEEVHLHSSEGSYANTSLFNVSTFVMEKSRCHNPVLLKTDFHFGPSCDLVLNRTTLDSWMVYMTIEIRKDKILRNVYRCDSLYSFDGCPLQPLAGNVTLYENESIVQEFNGVIAMYNQGEYTLLEDAKYAVCMRSSVTTSSPTWFQTVIFIDGYVSVIGTAFSLVCYVILLVKYYFYECYSVPNMSACALYFTLLLGDGTFFLLNMIFVFAGKPTVVTCDVLAILEHFLLISSQIWCVVMSYDISRSLKSSNVYSVISKKSRFIKQCAGVYLGSLAVVGTVVYLRESDVLYDNHQTKRNVCLFDAGLYFRIILRIAPLVLTSVLSAFFIARAICYISHENRENNRILNRESSINITKITLKLAILCGLPEGIGLVNIPYASLSNTESSINIVFGLLYSISKGFRGVMLLLLYLCKTNAVKQNSEINPASSTIAKA